MPHIIARAKGKVFMPDGTEQDFGVRFPFRDPEIAKLALTAEELDAYMAITYTTAAVATAMLACITTTGLFMSIHTASPGTGGANEIAYSTGYTGNRPAIAWAGFSTDHQTSNNTQTYPLLAIQASGIPYFGLWTAATSGTYLTGGATSGLTGSIPSGANVTFTSSVTLTLAA
jgi:hypothetical protein